MWSNIAVGFATLILAFFLYILEMKRRYRSIGHYPGPKRTFLLGNVLDLGTNPIELTANIQKFTKKYGKNFQIWIGPNRPQLWTSDVKFMEYILSSTKHIEKSPDYHFLHKWLGSGLLVSAGPKWRKRRKFINPAFHFKVLEQFIEVFNNCGKVLIDQLSKEVGKDSVNIYPFITLFSLDIISETAMGVTVNAQLDDKSDYVKAVDDSCNVLLERTFSAWKQFDLLYSFSESYKTHQKSLKILHDFTNGIIAQKKAEMLEEEKNKPKSEQEEEFSVLGIKKRMAFLDLLLRTTYDGERLSDDDIREEVDTFMFAGHDTTASALSFALYEIAKKPEIQDKILDDISSILGNDKTKEPNYQELMAMKYLELVIKEVLRLYPSVPYYAREIKEDLVFEGVTIPAGLTVTMVPLMLHRNPDIFEDPEKFIPERFLQENMKDKSPYSYLPFSAGLRNCIGQKFAMLELKASICKILRKFELSSVPGHKLILSAEVVLKSANGICIRLKNRNNEEHRSA